MLPHQAEVRGTGLHKKQTYSQLGWEGEEYYHKFKAFKDPQSCSVDLFLSHLFPFFQNSFFKHSLPFSITLPDFSGIAIYEFSSLLCPTLLDLLCKP